MTDADAAAAYPPPAPIPVRVTNHPAAPGRGERHATPRTRNLTAAAPIAHLAPYDATRLYLLIQAGGNNVVLCTDLSQAQDPANQVPGVPNPDGFLLSAGNTMPVKLEGTQPVWAVGNTYPAQVTYITVHERA